MMLSGMLLLTASGCQAIRPTSDNATRLIAHPHFDKVVKASPEWTTEALKTINNLEFRLEIKR